MRNLNNRQLLDLFSPCWEVQGAAPEAIAGKRNNSFHYVADIASGRNIAHSTHTLVVQQFDQNLNGILEHKSRQGIGAQALVELESHLARHLTNLSNQSRGKPANRARIMPEVVRLHLYSLLSSIVYRRQAWREAPAHNHWLTIVDRDSIGRTQVRHIYAAIPQSTVLSEAQLQELTENVLRYEATRMTRPKSMVFEPHTPPPLGRDTQIEPQLDAVGA